MLKSIHGLAGITTLPGAFTVSNNASLEDLVGLDNLTEIQGLFASLVITDNPWLKNVDALSSLENLDGERTGTLTIVNNPLLTNIDGLSSLRALGGEIFGGVEIADNAKLKNINGLLSLSSMSWGPSGGISIRNNSSPENVDGLSSLTQVGGPASAFSVQVSDNPLLKRCCGLYPLFSALGPGAVITVSGNAAGCTKEDILAGGPCGEAIGNSIDDYQFSRPQSPHRIYRKFEFEARRRQPGGKYA